MNFQSLMSIEKADTYLDTAFRAARTLERPKIRDRIKAVKTIELKKLDTVRSSLTNSLKNILKSFPSIDDLAAFYLELIKTTLDYRQLKKCLGAVDWAIKKVNVMHKVYSLKIKRTQDTETMKALRTQFYGRISSVVKQIKNELQYLNQVRMVLRRFPTIKTDCPTIAIAGYPNVGKSSLLQALTSARPEIREYAFTTKALNLGYFRHDKQKVQVVDTPGLFDRNIHDMNNIEKQAFLVLKYVADIILFMIDPTESCGYSTKKQQRLLQRTRSFKKKILVVNNKADLIENRQPGKVYISTKTKEGVQELIKKIIHKELIVCE